MPSNQHTQKPKTQCDYPSASEDFFRHINGKWLDETEIPPTNSRWGPFDILRRQTSEQLDHIINRIIDSPVIAKKGSNEQLVADYYRSAVDMEARNRLGLTPLDKIRARIDTIETKTDIAACIAELSEVGPDAFFVTYPAEDEHNAGWNTFYIAQGGLGLPDRDYYLSNDNEMTAIQAAYKTHITNLFTLAGRSAKAAISGANSVYAIEYQLASAARTRADTRQVEKNYTKYSINELETATPTIDWGAYFQRLGIPNISDVVVCQPEFLDCVDTLLATENIQAIRDYFTMSLLRNMAAKLDQNCVDEIFDFYGRTLSGTEIQTPLWEKAVTSMCATELTNAIGPLYCKQYFNQADKERVSAIVTDVCAAFAHRVKGLDWMSEETKAATLQKLAGIDFNMGFPDTWIDVSPVDITPDTYAENRINLTRFNMKRELAKVGKPYDHSEWDMAPTTVNACADLKRTMTFPAAILQPPFYNTERDSAYNYGAIGAVIGHELSHFFDDQGGKYDLDGNVKDWWREDDRQNFASRAQDFIDYFGSQLVDGVPVNGALTNGENIADVAGIAVAFDAYQASAARQDITEILDGLAPEQRFFTGFARIWASKITPESAKILSMSDPHAPGEVRVNGVLRLNADFHKAFGIKPGDVMYTPTNKRPKLW